MFEECVEPYLFKRCNEKRMINNVFAHVQVS